MTLAAKRAPGKVAERAPRPAEAAPRRRARAGTRAVAPAATGADPVAAPPLELYLLRHADAGDATTWEGDDAARPLSKKGRKQARRLGRHLDDLGIEVSAILTSPRVRAADTARIVGKALGVKPATEPRVDSGFDRAALAAVIGDLEAMVTSVILVGHDPDFSALASWLTSSTVEMRKGAIAKIDVPGRMVGAGAGALRWLVPPDALRG